jgi:hypothetical protein
VSCPTKEQKHKKIKCVNTSWTEHVLELCPCPLQRLHLILMPTLEDFVDELTRSAGSILLFVCGLPGIFFTIGGNGLGSGDTGHADSCSTGCRTC